MGVAHVTLCFFSGNLKSEERVMLAEKEIERLISELIAAEIVHVDLNGSFITMKAFDNRSKLFLSTPVYFGSNYIPKSVRQCLGARAPFDSDQIRTNLKVDEDAYEVSLQYIGRIETINKDNFIGLLEEYCWLANRWREYLDEHDRNDLVYINAR